MNKRHVFGSLAEGYLLAGRIELTARFAEQTRKFSHQHRRRSGEALALRLLGEITASRNPPEGEKAELSYSQSINVATEHGMRPLVAHRDAHETDFSLEIVIRSHSDQNLSDQ